MAGLLVVLFGHGLASESAAGPPTALVITGATLIDGSGAAPRPRTTIVIRDGRIASVSPDDEVDRDPDAPTFDAEGKYVIPGLADMHVHFGIGAPLARREGETAEVLERQLYYGVTSVLQLGGSDGGAESIGSLRRRRAEGALQSPYVYGTGGHLTLQGAHPVYTIFPPRIREAADSLAAKTPLSEPVDLEPLGLGLSLVRSTESARLAVRERAVGGMDAIKITVESGPTPFGDHHPQMSVEMIRAIVAEAEGHGLKVFAHATSLDELQAALAGGAAGIVHAVRNRPLPDEARGEALAAAGFRVLPTLVLYAGAGDLDDPFLRETVSDEEIAALRDQRFLERIRRRWECCAPFDEVLASVGRLHEQGVPIVVGTDTGNAYVFPGYSVHRELELLVEAGLSPMEALVSATSAAAEMIDAADEFGTIEPGKRADLLILAADPLEDIRNTRSLELVISEGRVIDRKTLLGPPDPDGSHAASP